ncbi:MAG: hypothetical protein ABJA02_05255 [Acidobacteriota bacterium]
MDDNNETGSNAVWAIAMVIIVAIIVGVIYYSGVLQTVQKKDNVDIKISAPSSQTAPPAAPAR